MSLLASAKRITDPIYGTIELTDVEADLVSSGVFQRLHQIRQLGLAYLVFPSAGYSRFSHSVGAAFNAGRIMDAINRNRSRPEFSLETAQLFRIAGLFHDLGHYPFSHTTEHAVEAHYANNFFEPVSGSDSQVTFTKSSFTHEKLGEKILEHDPELNRIFDKYDLSVEDIQDLFLDLGKKTIISSDLDCDRLDYLGRTAHHSGAPYGSVDVDFIISQATLDKDRKFCFGYKSFRAVDHLLVSRFFDFSQIPFHKTVASLEWSLEACICACLERGLLQYSQDELVDTIRRGEWWRHDEPYFIEMFRTLLAEPGLDEVLKDHLRATLFRKAAKQVCMIETFSRDLEARASASITTCEEVVRTIVAERLADARRLYVWSPKFRYAKSSPVAGRPLRALSEDEQHDLIHVLQTGKKKSVPLVGITSSLAAQLSDIKYDLARVYYLPKDGETEAVISTLRTRADKII